ncbi:MAG: C39 family peptidase [Mahellales bacterium]|jgi:peptidoglycan hydrolase CwlO-like protein
MLMEMSKISGYRMKNKGYIIIFFILVFLMVTNVAVASEKTTGLLNELEEQKRGIRSQLQLSITNQTLVSEELTQLENELEEKISRLEATEQALLINLENLDQARQQLKDAQQRLDQKMELLGQRLRALYMIQPNQWFFELIFTSENMADLIKRLEVVRQVADYEGEIIRDIEQCQQDIEQRQATIREDMKEQRRIIRELEDQQIDIKLQMEKREEILYRLEEEQARIEMELMAVEQDIDYIKTAPKDISTDYRLKPFDTVRGVPRFYQFDPQWCNIAYDWSSRQSRTIYSSGCGPVASAMVITGLGGYNRIIDLNQDGIIDPIDTSRYALSKGHRQAGGTSREHFKDVGEACGLTVEEYSPSQGDKVFRELEKGNPVVAAVRRGTFSRTGHYIVLVGIDEKGMVIVNDPGSENRTKQRWGFNKPILAEARYFWVFKNEKNQ